MWTPQTAHTHHLKEKENDNENSGYDPTHNHNETDFRCTDDLFRIHRRGERSVNIFWHVRADPGSSLEPRGAARRRIFHRDAIACGSGCAASEEQQHVVLHVSAPVWQR